MLSLWGVITLRESKRKGDKPTSARCTYILLKEVIVSLGYNSSHPLVLVVMRRPKWLSEIVSIQNNIGSSVVWLRYYIRPIKLYSYLINPEPPT